MRIREYRAVEDFTAVRTCLIQLQEVERALDPRVPPGATIADRYLEGLWRRCNLFAGQVFVAEADGRVVGFVSVLGACRSDAPDDDATAFAYVDDLVVLSHYRGQGIGQALLDRAEAYAATHGRTIVRLRVKGGNHAARGFYTRAGYAEYELELEKHLTRGSGADA